MHMIVIALLLLVSSVRASSSSSCPDDEAVDDKVDVAISQITRIVKETCSCPMYLRPIDCEEVLANGHTNSGVYTIWPKKTGSCGPKVVYCDMDTDGGGWIVIQRRGDDMIPDDFFNKDWQTYKKGFGDLNSEFWLGNDLIHNITTTQGSYSARFDMRNHKGEEKFALYKDFSIADEKNNYRLTIGGYSGTAGGAITNHNQRDFYTRDRPNPPAGIQNFRKVPNSGWWFNVFPSSNLNGLKKTKDKDGIVWYFFGGYSPPLTFTEIKLRAKR